MPFHYRDILVGYVKGVTASILSKYSDTIHLTENELRFTSDMEAKDFEAKTLAMAKITTQMRGKPSLCRDITALLIPVVIDDGIIKGWRDELLPVVGEYSQDPIFLLERAAVPFFGLKGYGVHVNGFVTDDDGNVSHMWVGKRSKTKSLWPSMLDHIVAGIY